MLRIWRKLTYQDYKDSKRFYDILHSTTHRPMAMELRENKPKGRRYKLDKMIKKHKINPICSRNNSPLCAYENNKKKKRTMLLVICPLSTSKEKCAYNQGHNILAYLPGNR